ncbi:MATE family efflux transporter [Pedobacter cryophilus]|uniref:Polysaccharide biosynthesis protein C-terminal domain-containing protein n=1 Tax=Pedobacter cryophilus TaxID=2571271 RepID=A0A4U1BX99_9SPHI|nr:hypothetical protein [Pedobacter cryophilus]TKB96063.1 hypothetical protein FA046_15470 [Pedobacter cryophilus]
MFKKIIFSFQSNFIVAVLALVLTLLTAKFLGAYGRGYLSIIATYIAFIQLITGILGPGTLAFLMRVHKFSELFLLSFLWSLVISIFSTFLLNTIGLINQQVTLIFFLNCFLLSIFSLNLRGLINKSNLNWYNILIVLQPLVILACLSYSGLNNFTALDFLYFQNLSYLLVILISILVLRDEIFVKINFSELIKLTRSAFKIGGINQLSNLTQLFNYRLSFFFLEKWSGLNAVGIFSIILSIANVIWLFAITAGTLIGDEISKVATSTDKGLKLINRYLKISVGVSLIFLFAAFILPSSFYIYLLNNDFSRIKFYLVTFSPGILIFSIAKVLAYYFSNIGKVRINLISSFGGIVPTFLGFFLVKYYAINGVIISTSFSFLISTYILIYFYIKENKKY